LSGLAALARPNLLLVAALWCAGDLLRGRPRRAALLALGVALVLLPVLARNLAVSGHPVLISSNGGLTSYHGNGPGALGVYTPPRGFSGDLLRQREEATLLARRHGGPELDPVEADRWWGREALRTRARDPLGTLELLVRRTAMTLDSHEYGLDYAPGLDGNRWSFAMAAWGGPAWPLLPLGLLLGLSAAGLLLRGPSGTGGYPLWSALLACAAAPLLFYVSSRYRLPFAALLVVPAGCGVAALIDGSLIPRRRLTAMAAAMVVLVLSLLVPFHGLKRTMRAEDLGKRAEAWRRVGELDRAQREMDAALALAVESAPLMHNAGVLAEARSDAKAARRYYREAIRIDPGLAESAANLSALLIGAGRADDAVAVLLPALRMRPAHRSCWTNLVVARLELGQLAEARGAADEAARHGVRLPAGLLAEVERRERS
jgi:tetratricopeptide (TPR) repeat protein